LVLATPSPLATIHSTLFSGNPDTINLHVLMVLSIGGIVNAILRRQEPNDLQKDAYLQFPI